jgi:hypothetical protein
MTGPVYENRITSGNVITLAGMFLAGGIAYATLDARGASNTLTNDRQDIRIALISSDLSQMAISAARNDEKLSHILTMLAEINTRLKEIENRP